MPKKISIINQDLIAAGDPGSIKRFLDFFLNKKGLFICVIGNTETGKIPGISAAGANPEITDYTPAADVEFLYYGSCKVIDGVPITPEGIPTPGLITKSALELSDMPLLVAVAGVNIFPNVPFIDLHGKAGGNIRAGSGVENPREIFDNAKILGENISKLADYLVIGESIAGGTTTALGLLTALGYEAKGKVSSSLPDNPISLKEEVVNSGLEKIKSKNKSKSKSKDESTPDLFRNDPFKAVAGLGDPMQPAVAGITIGAGKRIPVILAGGTQMAAITALINALDKKVLDSIVIGTTKWILTDEQSDIAGIVTQINPKIPILAANFDFSKLKYNGLQVYEKGIVKEGVGAGGISVASILSSNYKININKIQKRLENIYEKIKPSA
ncbi:MAG: nicotinate mononucleotide-dependent phosphoribosyltransferase CobT [Promethearchaeota archaeon]